MKCDDAHKYCEEKKKKGGLLTLSDDDQLNSLLGDQDFPIWIGLQRNGQTWKWSAGLSNYTNWAPDEPSNSKNCVSISSLSKNMTTQDCSSRFPFLCYRDNLVLVEENKTWEEALEHCRALSSPTSYDLVSIQPEDYDYVMEKLVEANAEEVWTGLRFLAGKWLWVNGADMLYSDLPLCPPMVQHCGVLSTNSTGSMENRDCAERKYFMCYRK
ncbi:C-type mannose receptor 2-like [Neolamprologus brichardi]|uniref:C-type mannose receptor 2-like n=1 Tax=Neolamprologus brichardi TaxID=32507 RepID=UPI001643EB04|nr:C-type mannose receptor 2-like [Neolamprologus brichardi]